jgi:peptidoglycan/LPS O-acetylase OafA/YrhL
MVLAAVPLGFVTGMKNIFVWMPLLVALLTAAALVLGTRGEWGGLLSSRVLGWVGRRAYGLYLWHYAAVTALAGSGLPWRAWAPLYVVVTLVAATLSWRYIEQPFLRPRPERSTRSTRSAAHEGPVVPVGALAAER